MRSFAERLQGALEARGMEWWELEEALAMRGKTPEAARKCCARWRAGAAPTFDNLQELEPILECGWDYLMAGEGPIGRTPPYEGSLEQSIRVETLKYLGARGYGADIVKRHATGWSEAETRMFEMFEESVRQGAELERIAGRPVRSGPRATIQTTPEFWREEAPCQS